MIFPGRLSILKIVPVFFLILLLSFLVLCFTLSFNQSNQTFIALVKSLSLGIQVPGESSVEKHAIRSNSNAHFSAPEQAPLLWAQCPWVAHFDCAPTLF